MKTNVAVFRGPLSPKVHGVIDYLTGGLFLIAPAIFGFGGAAATLSVVLGVVLLATSLVTAYPLGAAKLLPFPIHGLLELGAGLLLLIAPFLFSFRSAARRSSW